MEFYAYNSSVIFSHSRDDASLGILRSPRGDTPIEPTLGPSGKQERLNCWLKKRLTKFFSHLRSFSSLFDKNITFNSGKSCRLLAFCFPKSIDFLSVL